MNNNPFSGLSTNLFVPNAKPKTIRNRMKSGLKSMKSSVLGAYHQRLKPAAKEKLKSFISGAKQTLRTLRSKLAIKRKVNNSTLKNFKNWIDKSKKKIERKEKLTREFGRLHAYNRAAAEQKYKNFARQIEGNILRGVPTRKALKQLNNYKKLVYTGRNAFEGNTKLANALQNEIKTTAKKISTSRAPSQMKSLARNLQNNIKAKAQRIQTMRKVKGNIYGL